MTETILRLVRAVVSAIGLILAVILILMSTFGPFGFEDRVMAMLTAITLILLCKDDPQ